MQVVKNIQNLPLPKATGQVKPMLSAQEKKLLDLLAAAFVKSIKKKQ